VQARKASEGLDCFEKLEGRFPVAHQIQQQQRPADHANYQKRAADERADNLEILIGLQEVHFEDSAN